MKPQRSNGSVLVEVLLAVAIMGIILSYVVHSYLSAYRATVHNVDYSKALFFLENHAAELVQTGDLPIEMKGTYDAAQKYSYEITSSPWSGNGNLLDVGLTVRWKSGRQTKKISLSMLLPSGTADAP